MRISKKNKKRIFESLSLAFNEILSTYFDENEIQHSPETWLEDTREKFDLLSEYEHLIQIKLEEIINEI